MEISKQIGISILELRKNKGLSQEALANLAEIDRTYMTGVETGKRNISVKVLLKIITALGSNYRSFFDHPSFDNTNQ